MARRGMTVEILGIARLRQQLEDVDSGILDAIRRAVTESSEAVKADTKRDVAKDTNNLEEKVDARPADDGFSATVGWHEAEEYYSRFVEVGTRRAPAQPSLGPALEAERHRYRARLTDEVREALR
ncbi:HK97-gp10 family putative phage morphogenesis protein [Streptomyces sp. NPDC060198]|uniref:HK97-gp10 family putative phage morphogenesis protein n=1 Tax=Streptomyces sp. NPDC060198 TaxID=3347070 RepID=UPI00365728FF